jgi:nicotinate-nucleotide adenylyltransferase
MSSSADPALRIGILGGTFDPPHLGHLIVGSDACDVLGLDRLLFVPAAVPPHKPESVVATPEQRFEMVHAAIAGDPRFEADDLELRREGASYSVDTLRVLHERYPGAELFFILGVDQIRELESWREPREIARLARIAAVARAGDEIPALRHPVLEVPVTRIDVSSTEVRMRVREGRPVRYLVPVAVAEVIERYELYRR